MARKKHRPLQKEASHLSTVDSDRRVNVQPKLNDLRVIPEVPNGDAPEWKAVERFLQRPWFLRMLTYQEVVLSRICIARCGSYSMTWSDLSDSCLALTYGGFDDFVDQDQRRVTQIQVHRLSSRESKSTTLCSLLEANRFRNSTEPRDMVYALRGIMNRSVAEAITVSYRSPSAVVYAKAVKVCIIIEEVLTVLESVEYRRNEESGVQMPSWVPDWRYATSVAVNLSMRRDDGGR